jgi:hypothetical protein
MQRLQYAIIFAVVSPVHRSLLDIILVELEAYDVQERDESTRKPSSASEPPAHGKFGIHLNERRQK